MAQFFEAIAPVKFRTVEGQLDPKAPFRTNVLDTPVGNATMDIGGWLRGLGFGQYEAAFRESEIDAEVLPELTESDLSQLGVPLGHRNRLLKAIVALGATEKPPATASDHPDRGRDWREFGYG